MLDYAILVVSATDGVQGYTQTLWRLLKQYNIPTFIFVNKLDAPGTDRNQIIAQLQETLSAGAIPFDWKATDDVPDDVAEEIALQDENVLADYLDNANLADDVIKTMIANRQVFPVYFGSGLKMTGIDELLNGLEKWTKEPTYEAEFAAQVFKISHANGERLTWMRMTGGALATKEVILPEQKVNQLRLYNGTKYEVTPRAVAGEIVVVPGLTDTFPGQGLGAAENAQIPTIQPVLTYAVNLQDEEVHAVLAAMRELEDEDPLLKVSWSEQLQEIRVQLMGTIQLEVLRQQLKDRFGLAVDFDEGGILYQETITHSVEGVGHFEPLRHYAEVHLLMEPTAPGTGLTFATDCQVDVLGNNWQHQVLSNLGAKPNLGS
ncbi:ribosome protection-type tetracycline resistance related proteins, group 2 [Lentilactobacillus kosonis]|uniref:Ribosome protection-type tetracycline resistance related proteins, group 2 n=1 Tax=Lentilactobacillus kosonis TaxID=2810561 RepID=A0A401FI79_9LACO|nr:ribosome protection-type tetracycline resistance related proteins, group 2 [Lentilactobacillus kosonis]